MRKPRRGEKIALVPDDAPFAAKQRKLIPHEFVLDAIASMSPRTNPMFGCLAVYVQDGVQEKIVLILREKPTLTADNGVWLATTQEHHESLRQEFPRMRSVGVFGKEVTDWQVLPSESGDFEEAAMRACDLILARDPRIGKVPKSKRTGSRKATPQKKKKKLR